jgi:hypothetical protein
MDNDSGSDYSSRIYYNGPSRDDDSDKEVILAEMGKVIFGL